MTRLFVYYTVPDERRDDVAARLRAVHAALGVAARVMRRRGDASDTWLEFYDGVDDAFEGALDALVERHGLAALTGPRRAERFVDVSLDPT